MEIHISSVNFFTFKVLRWASSRTLKYCWLQHASRWVTMCYVSSKKTRAAVEPPQSLSATQQKTSSPGRNTGHCYPKFRNKKWSRNALSENPLENLRAAFAVHVVGVAGLEVSDIPTWSSLSHAQAWPLRDTVILSSMAMACPAVHWFLTKQKSQKAYYIGDEQCPNGLRTPIDLRYIN